MIRSSITCIILFCPVFAREQQKKKNKEEGKNVAKKRKQTNIRHTHTCHTYTHLIEFHKKQFTYVDILNFKSQPIFAVCGNNNNSTGDDDDGSD